jgi:tetratricopeptide (TPR) repeat protein
LQNAQALREAGRLDEAERIYRQVIEAEARFRLNLASADPLQAEILSGVGLAAKAKAHVGLGDVLMDRDEVAGAIAACRQAAEIKPDLAMAHFKLGAALYSSGDKGAAFNSFRSAAKLEPNNQHYWRCVGGLFQKSYCITSMRTY